MNKPKYPPPLNKKRQQEDLPGLLSEDFQTEMNKISVQGLRKDFEGLIHLAEHYGEKHHFMCHQLEQLGIGEGAAFYMALSLCLARDHVPGFQAADKRGRKMLSEAEQAQIVSAITAEMIQHDCDTYEASQRIDGVTGNRGNHTYQQWRTIRGHIAPFGLMIRIMEDGYLSAVQLHAWANSARTIDDLPQLSDT